MRFENKAVFWDISLRYLIPERKLRLLRKVTKKDKRKRARWIEWIVLEIGIDAGLRVAEIASLTCGDIVLNGDWSFIVVEKGKGGKRREVLIGKRLVKNLSKYLKWKECINESIKDCEPLLLSPWTKSFYTTRALQKMFKKILLKAEGHIVHSIHHLRHTYATTLLVHKGVNVHAVQKQLGHSSMQVTECYWHCLGHDVVIALNSL